MELSHLLLPLASVAGAVALAAGMGLVKDMLMRLSYAMSRNPV